MFDGLFFAGLRWRDVLEKFFCVCGSSHRSIRVPNGVRLPQDGCQADSDNYCDILVSWLSDSLGAEANTDRILDAMQRNNDSRLKSGELWGESHVSSGQILLFLTRQVRPRSSRAIHALEDDILKTERHDLFCRSHCPYSSFLIVCGDYVSREDVFSRGSRLPGRHQ